MQRLLGFAFDDGVPDAIGLAAVKDALDRAGLPILEPEPKVPDAGPERPAASNPPPRYAHTPERPGTSLQTLEDAAADAHAANAKAGGTPSSKANSPSRRAAASLIASSLRAAAAHTAFRAPP